VSTVAKGDAFEDEIYSLLKRELENGRLGIDANCAQIWQKKAYYSKDREKDVVVDIAIEVWPPGADNYALLWVCECKDCDSGIPVDDIEEFKAKLDQIAGKNVKGVVATRRAFQKGALTYARNQGIGVVRVMPDDQVSWVVHLAITASVDGQLDPREFNAALTRERHQATGRRFYAAYDGYIFNSWNSLFQHAIGSNS